jgi:hypothetical protein
MKMGMVMVVVVDLLLVSDEEAAFWDTPLLFLIPFSFFRSCCC